MPPSYQKNYTGPAIPTTYDLAWQTYTNLNDAQKAWFGSQPPFLTKCVGQARWQKEIAQLTIVSTNTVVNGMVLDMSADSQRKIAGLKQAVDNGALTGSIPFIAVNGIFTLAGADVSALYQACVARVQATYTVAATLLGGINASPPTVTTKAQIDTAMAAVT